MTSGCKTCSFTGFLKWSRAVRTQNSSDRGWLVEITYVFTLSFTLEKEFDNVTKTNHLHKHTLNQHNVALNTDYTIAV